METREYQSGSTRYLHDSSSSRFLGSSQGLFHPFSVNVRSVDRSPFLYSYPAERRDFPGETTAVKSLEQAVTNKHNKEKDSKTTLAKHGERRKESKDGKPTDGAHNGTSERQSYWERRRKNNASAKKSRDARKARELQTKIKADFLERENLRVLAQLVIVQKENACLKRVLWDKLQRNVANVSSDFEHCYL